MSQLTEVSSAKCFEGVQKVFSHMSDETQCKMTFSIYIPPKASEKNKVPVIYWLSGLTCTEQNFIIKSGFQRYASELNICVVGPDTSPRGCDIPGEDDSWDHGTGAGFYVDATEEKWKKHYRMHSYVTKELIDVIEKNFPFVQPGIRSISGHSMGGHGALVCSLRNPGLYKCATAFAPIANPSKTGCGIKNFTAYLGPDKKAWEEWDASHLVGKYSGPPLNVLVDQGSADKFMDDGELLPKALVDACAKANFPLNYREQEGYEHGYFFVSTFLEEHFKHHLKFLK